MTSQQKRKRKVLLEGWRRFVVSSFVVRQLLAKSNKHGTNIDHKWDQSGPSGEQRVLENQRDMKKEQKKSKSKEAK